MMTAPHRRFPALISRAEAEFDGPLEGVPRQSPDVPKFALGAAAWAAYIGDAQAAR
ncbi:hypothetical protein [Streptomyces wuyuanensis]|uniref:hypothetical protein n=1 Tax=Streptomyces wuyuanensis TaxID=1196353 RepID=UPI00142FDEF6|nr:hypothetical protein [Streptomyces wuyuanensis]